MTLAVLALIFRFVNLREVNSEHYELYNTAKKHYLDTICHFDNVYYIYMTCFQQKCVVFVILVSLIHIKARVLSQSSTT